MVYIYTRFSAKDKRQKEKTCMLYTIFLLALLKLQKRQKDIHPAQTQHNTQQENSTRVKWCKVCMSFFVFCLSH